MNDHYSMTDPKALVALLNSRAHAGQPDALDAPHTALPVLRALGHEDDVAAPELLDDVRAVRADLMAILESGEGWERFSERTSAVAFRYAFSPAGGVEPDQVAGDPVVGSIARQVAQLVAADAWPRLKVCANHRCARVFYDTTRSRTQRWHSYKVCGNKSNVAAHRARAAG
jgi:predicted RNA-binding Zn ribbon-like protein